MRDYREALLVDMKAIGNNIASIQMVSVFLLKTEICKNTSILNRNFLHFIRFDDDCNASSVS